VEFNERSWRIPEKYVPFRYTVAVHGTGMADEWPMVYLHPDFDPGTAATSRSTWWSTWGA
jgi:hypothetical protein